MATKAKGSVRLAGRFPVGTEVGLYRRHADILHPGSVAIKKGKVRPDGEARFDGLDPGEALFVAGTVDEQWRFVAVTASGLPTDPDAPKPMTEKEVAEALTQTRPSTEDRTVIGARNTSNAKIERKARSSRGADFAHPDTGVPSAEVPANPVPALSQEDARDLDQMSATVTGQATPVESQPGLREVSVEEAKEKNLPTISGGETGVTFVVEALERQQEAERKKRAAAARKAAATKRRKSAPRKKSTPRKRPRKR